MADFIPSTDAGLLEFATPMSAKLTATPVPYGVTAGNATTLATKLSAFDAAVSAATDPATRGLMTIATKDSCRADLVSYIRSLVRQIQGTMTVTNLQREELGIPVRDTEPSPIGPPAMSPVIMVTSVVGFLAKLRLINPLSPTSRARPAGVHGASIFSYSGTEDPPPAEISAWTFQGSVTRMTDIGIQFDSSLAPGTKVYLTAFYFNPRSQSGIACDPVGLIVQGGGMVMAG